MIKSKTTIAKILGASALVLMSATSLIAQTMEDEGIAAAAAYMNGELEPKAVQVDYDGEPITVRFTTFASPNAGRFAEVIKKMFDRLEVESQGKLKGEIFWNASVHSVADGFKAARSGLTDLTPCYVVHRASAFNLALAGGLPGLFPNSVVGARVVTEVYDEFVRSEYEAQDVYLARISMTPQNNLVTIDPVLSMAEMEGLIVPGSGTTSKTIESLGMAPTAIPVTEWYTAFQRGTVDGIFTHDAGIEAFRYIELAKHHLSIGKGASTLELCMNKAFFDDLPADLQGLFADWLQRWSMVEVLYYLEGQAIIARENMKAAGIEFHELDAENQKLRDEAVEKVVQEFIEENGPEADAMIAKMRELVAEYEDVSWEQMMMDSINSPAQILPVKGR